MKFRLTFALLALATAFAAHANAAEQPVVSLQYPTQAVDKVTVYDNGLTVFELKGSDRGTQHQLRKESLEQVKSLAMALANAEIQTVHRRVICMMMPFGPQATLSVASHYDYQSGEFSGELKTALSPQGCWVSTSISPKEPWAMQDAESLEAMLRLLANELAQ